MQRHAARGRNYVVFCIQQNESAPVNCQSRRLAKFVVRVIFFVGKRSVACKASDRFIFFKGGCNHAGTVRLSTK